MVYLVILEHEHCFHTEHYFKVMGCHSAFINAKKHAYQVKYEQLIQQIYDWDIFKEILLESYKEKWITLEHLNSSDNFTSDDYVLIDWFYDLINNHEDLQETENSIITIESIPLQFRYDKVTKSP